MFRAFSAFFSPSPQREDLQRPGKLFLHIHHTILHKKKKKKLYIYRERGFCHFDIPVYIFHFISLFSFIVAQHRKYVVSLCFTRLKNKKGKSSYELATSMCTFCASNIYEKLVKSEAALTATLAKTDCHDNISSSRTLYCNCFRVITKS